MAKIELVKRVKYAGDIHKKLVELGWDLETAALFCDDLPDADVAPVRRGRWIWADDFYCRCSNCTQKAPYMPQYQDEPIATTTKFCPNCGARMDESGTQPQREDV